MAWFVPRPAPVYVVRWEGDVAVTGDPRLPTGYRYEVDGNGDLLVTDPRDRVKRVVSGAWFTGSAVVSNEAMTSGYQRVTDDRVWEFVLVSGSP